MLADSLYAISDFQQSAQIYESLLATYPFAAGYPGLRFKRVRALFRGTAYLTIEERLSVTRCLDSLLTDGLVPAHHSEIHRIMGQIDFDAEQYSPAAEHFLLALEADTGTADPGLLLKTGYSLKKSGLPLQCAAILSRNPGDTLLDVYQRFCRGQAFYLADSMEAAIGELDRLLRNYPRTHLRIRVRKHLADAYFKRKDYDHAEREYRTVFRSRRARRLRAEIRYRLAEISLLRGHAPEAAVRFTTVMKKHPGSDWATDAMARLDSLGIRSEEAVYHRGLVLAEHGRYDEALTLYHRFQEAFPASPRIPAAEYLAGKAHFRKKEPATALKIFRRFIHSYPDHALTASARLFIARCLRDLERLDDAREEYEKFARRHPGHHTAAEALWYTAWMHEAAGATAKAVRTYRLVSRKFHRSKYAWEAVWREGFCHYKTGDYGQALEVFGRLPDGGDMYRRDKAAFWTAKCRIARGDTAGADSLFNRVAENSPRTFYAVRAAERTGAAAVLPAGTAAVAEQEPEEEYVKQLDSLALRIPVLRRTDDGLEQDLNYRRGIRLLALGFRDEGVRELYQIERRRGSDPAVLYRLARVYVRHGVYNRVYRVCYRMLGKIHNGDVDRFPLNDLRLLYPPAYFHEITDRCAGKARNVDPFLVLSVMHQESRFDPDVISPAGARGLLQLMPATGEDMARRTGVPGFDAEMLTDPGVNMRLGIGYLAGLLDKYRETAHALSAYNAGEEKTDLWLGRESVKGDPDLFPEEVEFAETRKYVRSVLRNHHLYHHFWNRSGAVSGTD